MPYMKVVIDELVAKGLRDEYIVLVGGAPLNEEFGKAVGADAYCRDAAVAAETAQALVLAKRRWGGRVSRLMAELTVIRWRDIPAQVRREAAADRRDGCCPTGSRRRSTRPPCVAGLIGADDYRARWRRTRAPCGDDLEAEADARPTTPRGRASTATDGPDVAGEPTPRPSAATAGSAVTDTVVCSATREVVIGFDRPFVIIGERINPTGRQKLAAEMAAGDFSTVIADAVAQVEAGPTCWT